MQDLTVTIPLDEYKKLLMQNVEQKHEISELRNQKAKVVREYNKLFMTLKNQELANIESETEAE